MALRFWLGTGGDALWSNINNWAATSGGTPGVAVPLNSDDVTFDGNGNNPCTVNTSNRVAKTLTFNGYTNTVSMGAQNIAVSGSIAFTTTGFTLSSSGGVLRMIAAGTLTTNGKTIAVPFEIGGTTTFTATLADAPTLSSTFALTNTTSTIFAGAFNIACVGLTVSGSQTVTQSGNITGSGALVVSDACLRAGSFDMSFAGFTATGTLGVSANSPTLTLTGGTWSGTARCSVPLTFAGNVTVSGTVDATNVTYASGTITVAGSTLSLGAATTLATAGMSWDDVLITAAITVTLNSVMAAVTLTEPNAAVTWAGSAGYAVGTRTNTTITATRIYTYTAGNTYTFTTALNTVSAAAQTVRHTFTSSHGTNKAFFVLSPGATQDIGFCDPTRIDAIGGRTICTYHGTITDSPGWSATIPNARVQYRMAA